MKCVCGAQFRSSYDFFKHYNSPIHTNWTNLSKMYTDCGICYTLNKTSKYVDCIKCKNMICIGCYSNIVNNSQFIRCPYCRNSRF